ncbi:helix-turn-helix domain-containing protein [Streptomyces sp. NBC_00291]|uniref:helix-turn-helix domain-containing protein n=1 Tax=Streptomyces sp. NBC_00291 TaxID=2975704 RepID=UPI0022504A35|nr:helix-turn-helix domain-containing protein [Streptomyces sp. NBC_00291]MCX5155789.1 helix-turn-helix domain-containing protein [Streptomyces sp. NBC_00291]
MTAHTTARSAAHPNPHDTPYGTHGVRDPFSPLGTHETHGMHETHTTRDTHSAHGTRDTHDTHNAHHTGGTPDTRETEDGAVREASRVGALIRGHRLRIGMTQRELADLSTISVRAIRDLEQGKARRPRPDTVRLMADALRLGPRARAALEAAAQRGRPGGQGWAEPPAPPTALHAILGRDDEAGVLERELGSGAERLAHVVGLAGVGKTRLALEVADRLHRAGTPVLWHAFPGATADYLTCGEGTVAARVAATAARLWAAANPAPAVRAAHVPGGGDPEGAEAVSALAELLGDRAALLVLDGAPADPPRFDLLTALLRACPGLRLLVTSDRPWEMPGERIFLLSPPAVPAEGTVDRAAPAVRVFLDHVRRVRPGFGATSADLERATWICRRLDGHPGALAAAASWLVLCDLDALCRSLDADPAALLDHLGGGEGTGRLRRALHALTDRLTPGARGLLEELCAGSGPDDEFTLTGITALTGRDLPGSGRLLRELLISGAVRVAHEGDGSHFRVLGLVRTACRARAVAAVSTAS